MKLEILVFLANEDGGALAEYGILAAALAVPLIGALGAVSLIAGNTLQTTGNGLSQLGISP